MATHSSILAWEIPWTEEPGGLTSIGSQTLEHDSATEHTHTRHIEMKGTLQTIKFFIFISLFR